MTQADDLFETSIAEATMTAVNIATEAYSGQMGDIAEQAWKADVQRMQEDTKRTEAELHRMGIRLPWTTRMTHRVQMWWWGITDRIEDTFDQLRPDTSDEVFTQDDAYAQFAMPLPLLKTYPLQDVPFEYDEVDTLFAQVAETMAQAITDQTNWTRVAFTTPLSKHSDPDFDEEVFDEDYYDDDTPDYDPAEHVLAVWSSAAGTGHLFLVDTLDEDPKIQGQGIGIVHIPASADGPYLVELIAKGRPA
ncbi:MAG: hypothetical protein ACPG5U_05410 [Planktomarina sp.]